MHSPFHVSSTKKILSTATQPISFARTSSDLSYQAIFGHHAWCPLRNGVYLLSLSICIFFSSFNQQIPLLAPFALFFSLPNLLQGILKLRQYEWTIVKDINGRQATTLPHRKASETERELFEEKLVEAIKRKGTTN